MNSALFVGSIRHRRFSPVKHAFTYPMFMPLIDLDELEDLQSSVKGFGLHFLNFARFRTADYLRGHDRQYSDEAANIVTDNKAMSLKMAVVDKVESLTGERVDGRVMLLCQLRYAGLYFSPLNLYYLYDEHDNWRWVLAEVSNTPWNERHYYVLPAKSDWSGDSWKEDKAFHVSPFNPMSQQYNWRFRAPEKQLQLHLDIRSMEGNKKVLDATMLMKRQPFTSKVLWHLIAKTPIQTLKIVVGIYWQALRLWRKGAPFYSHRPSVAQPSKHMPTKHNMEQ
ncbi:DUF1365 domain-containing protein [Photobacterium sp. SDRW27]|uniref:DUF1365 domain-containing protein n=1 Tax=Photobacterium obscurum TaxID=2829490 RepID=UPI0022447D96|nr:DUF1365 domain-containing protein [Photobacterium obscurum]MCW8329358.1 DUF1365 domain-containing protein [Photobacterium obscurum]